MLGGPFRLLNIELGEMDGELFGHIGVSGEEADQPEGPENGVSGL